MDPPAAPTAAPTSPAPTYKLYSPGQICLAALLGSPLGGAVLLYKDFKRLGEATRARNALLAGFGITAALMALAWVLPDAAGRPLPGIFAVAYWQLAKGQIGPRFQAHQAARGAKESGWAAAGVGLLVMVGVLAAIAPIVLFTSAGEDPHVEFPGDQVVHFEQGATEADARQLGEALRELGFFNGKSGKDVYLEKVADGLAVSFILSDGAWDKPEIVAGFTAVREALEAGAFKGRHLTVRLCDDWQKTRKTIR